MPWEAAIRSRAMLAATKRFGVLWPRGAMPSVAIPAGQPAAQGTVPIHRPMLGNALTVAFLSGGMFSYAASPLILMQALGAGPAGSAGLLALSASGLLAGSLASSRLARTLDRRRIVIGGLVLSAAAGLALLGLAAAGLAQLAAVAILMAVYTFARSLVVPLATAAAMAPMGDAAGTAFGLLGALQMAGAVLAASGASLFPDPLLGMSATLALFAAAALACGLHADWSPGVVAGGLAGAPVRDCGCH